MMAPNRVKLEMLEQRIGQRRDATRALPQVPTGWGSFDCPASPTVGQNAVNPRGMGTASPYQISSLPDSKKELKKDVDKGWGVLVPRLEQLGQHHAKRAQADGGFGRGPGGPPHNQCRLCDTGKSEWHWVANLPTWVARAVCDTAASQPPALSRPRPLQRIPPPAPFDTPRQA